MINIKLNDIAYTRSGDKGPNVNIGVIFKNEKYYNWSIDYLTADLVEEYFGNKIKGNILRYKLKNLNSLNFILNDCLKGGGSETLINDAQGKTFGQALLNIDIQIPENLFGEEND